MELDLGSQLFNIVLFFPNKIVIINVIAISIENFDVLFCLFVFGSILFEILV